MIKYAYLALIIGAVISILISVAIYYRYEKPYLTLSHLSIFTLIATLIGLCLLLTKTNLITGRVDYETKYDIYGVDTMKGDPSKNLCKLEIYAKFFIIVL